MPNLYPTLTNEKEAIEYIKSLLPITTPNDLHAALMIYRNTLLQHHKD
jgi:hypothetical protein